jgi:hypothetical protein
MSWAVSPDKYHDLEVVFDRGGTGQVTVDIYSRSLEARMHTYIDVFEFFEAVRALEDEMIKAGEYWRA